MQLGKRSAQWDHTAALITHMRLAAGDKTAKPQTFHPYASHSGQREEFKQFIRKQKE